MKSFSQFITEQLLAETKFEMLDISIQNGLKLFKNDKSIQSMMLTSYRIEEKMDGIKLQILRNAEDYNPLDYTKNWIVSYKNYILYPFEHQDVKDAVIKKESFGNSQFKFIHSIIKKAHKKLKNIPKNTEFFLEYLMRKPTTTRVYSEDGIHSVILISHSPTNYTIHNGRITSTPSEFIQRDEIAHEFTAATGIMEPPIIFSGPLFIEKNGLLDFNSAGINNSELASLYNKSFKKLFKENILNKNYKELLSNLNQLFTSYPSSKGGEIEGSVFVPQDGSKVFKFVAADQYSKDKRNENKKNLIGEEDETQYYNKLENKADEINSTLDNTLTVEDILKEASHIIYTTDLSDIEHSTKTNLNKQDDLYLKVKNLVMDLKDPTSPNYVKQLVKDKTGLGFFIGKLRILTKAHFQIIEDALKKNPEGLILALVDTKKFGLPFEDRKKIIEEKYPEVKVIKVQNANFSWVLNPFKNSVSTIFCGEDNKVSYEKQLKDFNTAHSTTIILDVMKRSDDDISSTAVEDAIKTDNFKAYKQLTPPEMLSYWDQLKELWNE